MSGMTLQQSIRMIQRWSTALKLGHQNGSMTTVIILAPLRLECQFGTNIHFMDAMIYRYILNLKVHLYNYEKRSAKEIKINVFFSGVANKPVTLRSKWMQLARTPSARKRTQANHNWSCFNLWLAENVTSDFSNQSIRDTQRQFLENICSEDDLRSRIFWTFVVKFKFLACLPLLGFSSIWNLV